MIIELEWKEIIDYFEHHTLSDEQKKEISRILHFDIEWDDIIEYLDNNVWSSSENDEILESIGHVCEDEHEEFKYRLPVKNLDDEQKFEIVRNLYNNLTFQELQRIEKRIKITII